MGRLGFRSRVSVSDRSVVLYVCLCAIDSYSTVRTPLSAIVPLNCVLLRLMSQITQRKCSLLCYICAETGRMLSGGQAAQFAAEHSRVHDVADTEQQRLEQDYPPPPKKPLTPYMRFNKLVCNLHL